MLTMEQCIRETPERIYGIIGQQDKLFENVIKPDYTRIMISGSGSSYHAGTAAKIFMTKYTGLPVEVLYPFQVEDYIFTEPERTLFIGVSQSGTSLSAYRAMKQAREAGCHLASMSGREDKAVILNEVADDILTVYCGEEGDLQPKTKGMICTIVNLMLLALNWARYHKKTEEKAYAEALEGLKAVAGNMIRIVDGAEGWIARNGKKLAQSRDIRVIGTKDVYGIVLEGSLKLVETLRIPVSGYEFEEFIHGVYNAINKDSTVILLDTGMEARIPTLKKVLSEWAENVIICGKNAGGEIDFYIPDAGYPDYYTLEYILFIFMICEKVSATKGINIQTTKDTGFHAKLGSKILR